MQNCIDEIPTNIPPPRRLSCRCHQYRQECICSQLNHNFEKQKMKLREDYDIMFNQKTSVNVAQEIQIQFIKWESLQKKDKSMQCKIIFPVLYDQYITKNTYVFEDGKGLIKILLQSNKFEKKQLENYLKKNQVSIIMGEKYKGSIPLYKILSSNGNIISISLNELKNKKQVLKGHCFLKLVRKAVERVQEQVIPQKQNVIEEKQKKIDEYVWIYIQGIHFLKKNHWNDANVFLKLRTNSNEQLKTKTVWNCSQPVFNQIFTLKKMNSKLEIWNKQKQERLIGFSALPIDTQKILFDHQLPVASLNGEVIGYISICMGSGTIIEANQFMRTHYRKHQVKEKERVKENVKSSQRSEKSQRQERQNKEEKSEKSEKQQTNKQKSQEQEISEEKQKSEEQNNIRIIKKGKKEQKLNILEMHNVIFTKWFLEKEENDIDSLFSHQYVSMVEFQKQTGEGFEQFMLTYFNSEKNKIDFSLILDSFEAFKVYYNSLLEERNEALAQFINLIEDQGLTINQVESYCQKAIQKAKKNERQKALWDSMKRCLANRTKIEKLRYFYEEKNLYEICDCLRKFEVFSSSQKQMIPTIVLQNNIIKEIYELLQLYEKPINLQKIIRQNQIQLSRWEELNLFNSQLKSNKMDNKKLIKSPTFGVLGTDRVYNENQGNTSLEMKSQNQYSSQINEESSIKFEPQFGRSISPIYQNEHKQIRVKFSNVEGLIKKMKVNGSQVEIFHAEQKLPIKKNFSYKGQVAIEEEEIEFDGFHGEWIALVDDNGIYRGCLIFQ